MFDLVGKLDIRAAIPDEVAMANVAKSLKRHRPWFQDWICGRQSSRFSVVGGGPSLAKQEDIPWPVMAAGSVHDHLVSRGIIPQVCVIADPDPVMARYLSRPSSSTVYLVASQCDDAVFSALEDSTVVIWNCYSDALARFFGSKPFIAVGGGCTVGLMALSIATLMHVSRIDLFGFDSCVGENGEHHAYRFLDETETIGEIRPVKIGLIREGEGKAKTFMCADYHMAQLAQFREFIVAYGNKINVVVHGDGAMAEMMRVITAESERMAS